LPSDAITYSLSSCGVLAHPSGRFSLGRYHPGKSGFRGASSIFAAPPVATSVVFSSFFLPPKTDLKRSASAGRAAEVCNWRCCGAALSRSWHDLQVVEETLGVASWLTALPKVDIRDMMCVVMACPAAVNLLLAASLTSPTFCQEFQLGPPSSFDSYAALETCSP
jgi:hypothetical protein